MDVGPLVRLLGLLFAIGCTAGCSGSGSGGDVVEDPASSARVRATIAYVVFECRVAKGEARSESRVSFAWELRVQRGDAESVAVRRYATTPIPGSFKPEVPGDISAEAACQIIAEAGGNGGVYLGPFQYVTVSRDGQSIVFEVSDDFSRLVADPNAPLDAIVPPEEEGIFVVGPDGAAPRRIGPASGILAFILDPAIPIKQAGFSLGHAGRLLAYVGIGTDRDGHPAPEVFTLDVATGERRQLTDMPVGPPYALVSQSTLCCASFLEDGRILFFATNDGYPILDDTLASQLPIFDRSGFLRAAYVISPPGGPPEVLRGHVSSPDGGSRPAAGFVITSENRIAVELSLDRLSERDCARTRIDAAVPGIRDLRRVVYEIFLMDEGRLLQLTRFGQGLTRVLSTFLGASREDVFFVANDVSDCTADTPSFHVLSVPATGGVVSRVMDLGADCQLFSPAQDEATESLIVTSSCDPLGSNPRGVQHFAFRPDGSGLRQITRTAGRVSLPGGGFRYEAVDIFSVGTRYRSFKQPPF